MKPYPGLDTRRLALPHLTLALTLQTHSTLALTLQTHLTLALTLQTHSTLALTLQTHLTLALTLQTHSTLARTLQTHLTLALSLQTHLTLAITLQTHLTLARTLQASGEDLPRVCGDLCRPGGVAKCAAAGAPAALTRCIVVLPSASILPTLCRYIPLHRRTASIVPTRALCGPTSSAPSTRHKTFSASRLPCHHVTPGRPITHPPRALQCAASLPVGAVRTVDADGVSSVPAASAAEVPDAGAGSVTLNRAAAPKRKPPSRAARKPIELS